jgi:hypothetical protein
MKSCYGAYVPSFAVSYDVLGDQEAMTLKYTWELTIYFAFYVFPFINDLFTEQKFIPIYLSKFSHLGLVNSKLQGFIKDYYHWRKLAQTPARSPTFNDFMELGPLRNAESTFYCVGVSVAEAADILDAQARNLLELARFIVAHVCSVVLCDEQVLTNRAFVESINPYDVSFDLDAECAESGEAYQWSFDPFVLRRFRAEGRAMEEPEEPAGLLEDMALSFAEVTVR